MKLHLNPSRGNNSECMEVSVVILVCDTLSRSVSHNCKYDNIPKGFQVMKQKRNCI